MDILPGFFFFIDSSDAIFHFSVIFFVLPRVSCPWRLGMREPLFYIIIFYKNDYCDRRPTITVTAAFSFSTAGPQPSVRDDSRPTSPGGRLGRPTGRHPAGLLLAAGPWIRDRRLDAHLPNNDPGPRSTGSILARSLPNRPGPERHHLEGPRLADRAQTQRLLHRVSDRGPCARL